jgi:hypothetical protein
MPGDNWGICLALALLAQVQVLLWRRLLLLWQHMEEPLHCQHRSVLQ